MEKRKVLVSAYACEPNQGSEPGVGWHTVKELAKYHEVWVLTTHYHGRAIKSYLETHSIPNLHFVYLDPFNWIYSWSGRNRHWNLNFHYYFWQLEAYRVARKLQKAISFDIIHHVTYVRYWTPSFLAMLPEPFIFGTVGGGENTPRSLMSSYSLGDQIFELLRKVTQRFSELGPFLRLTARRCRRAVAATEETAERLRLIGARNVLIQEALGLSHEDIQQLDLSPPVAKKGIRFSSIGRLLHWKGFHLGLEAFARANLPNAEYWVIGTGPELRRLESLAHSLGIAQRVKFFGALDRAEVLERLVDIDVLVHPSMHDSGGMVCLEAMAARRPVVCLDLGGPSRQVTSETGIKVVATTLDKTIDGLKEAFIYLAEHPDERRELGQAGRQRVLQNYTWEIKGKKIINLYETVLQEV